MNIIVFKGKYVKPIIKVLNENGNHIYLVKYHGKKDLIFRNTIPLLQSRICKRLVITKKEYQKLIALIPLLDNPIEAFEMIYGEYFNDNTSSIDR